MERCITSVFQTATQAQTTRAQDLLFDSDHQADFEVQRELQIQWDQEALESQARLHAHHIRLQQELREAGAISD